MVGYFDDSDVVFEFVCVKDMIVFVVFGISCFDYFLCIKICLLVVDFNFE